MSDQPKVTERDREAVEPRHEECGYRCQFCDQTFMVSKWKGPGGTICPGCGCEYDYLLAQDGDDE